MHLGRKLLVAGLAVAILVPTVQHFSQQQAVPRPDEAGAEVSTCLPMHLNLRAVYSRTTLEEMLIAQLRANAEAFGDLDWRCLSRAFEVQAPNAGATLIAGVPAPSGARPKPDASSDTTHTAQFALDRSGQVFAVLRSAGFGASNGVFTAIFDYADTGEVAVVRRGGSLEWLDFGS